MAIKLHQGFISFSPSESWFSLKPNRTHFYCKEVADTNHLLYWSSSMQRCNKRHVLLECGRKSYSCRLVEFGKNCPTFFKARSVKHFVPLASADDGVTVNGNPRASTSSDIEEMRVKLSQSLQGEDYGNGLIQSLHDAARVYELAIKEESSLSKSSWFSTAWLGVDKNAWLKAVSYQAAVHSLLQAAIEISSRGDGRDRDVNVFVQKSLLRQSAPLESIIRDKLTAKVPEACEWFWSKQLPMVVTTFVNYFESYPQFVGATKLFGKALSLSSGNTCDISLLMLALTCIAAIMKLGPAKVSCSQFFSVLPDTTGRLMDMVVDFVPIRQAYQSINDIGLRREFLVHFGPRAATCRIKSDQGMEEVSFWVDLVQKQLQRAIDRERIWSRLTTCESIEVLEKDLSIFGFFIALGRSTQSFLYANGFDVIDDPIESFIRYLIGGSVLYYPQLSSISSYQLYVEVVCEELDWLPFYPVTVGKWKHTQDHKSKEKCPNAEAIPQALDVCSYWIQSFIKYSNWLEDPSNIKAARFLSKGHSKLQDCMEGLGILKNKLRERSAQYFGVKTASGTWSEKELDLFDKALESVEEALKRLEELLQELHVSSSDTGKEHLKAACSDLEKIRKLKKEAEFLEASFRAKAASLQQGDDDANLESSISEQRSYVNRQSRKSVNLMPGRSKKNDFPEDKSGVIGNRHGLWSFLMRHPAQKINPRSSNSDRTDEEAFVQTDSVNIGDSNAESNEIHRFEVLRNELIELEKRVQRSTEQPENDEDLWVTYDSNCDKDEVGDVRIVQARKRESVLAKSIEKLKETSTDVWQGTQLLAIDVAAAMGLLSRALTGDELTMKEKKVLQRTITDLASVFPIGILMLLPVTAVGHAAMLAAIQRYVPALIPSTYGPERLYLLRQLEKMKEMETSEMNSDEDIEGKNPSDRSPDNL